VKNAEVISLSAQGRGRKGEGEKDGKEVFSNLGKGRTG